ncbi:MAG: CCA tRNA nucleotidyltransferase [Cyanobacteria bacterium KgW148]|nr:CCA tRNA nucleotidyltransferase [Cyanobacteria bacterium KgW148]
MEIALPIDRGDLPQETYCVGGWVRDALLGRTKPQLDLDFVLPTAPIEVARRIAYRYDAGFVILDREREIARVVLPQGNLDFAKQVGNTILDDLDRRDFCMNAMALPVYAPTEIIDPHGGRRDIDQRIVRMVCPENIKDDPLRILRAYRQAAQLNFTIEPWTRQTIRQLAPLLPLVAIERVRMELGYLLQCPSGGLTTCIEDGILATWLETERLNLARFRRIDPTIGMLVQHYPQLEPYFRQELVLGHSIASTIKYSALVPHASLLDFLGLSRIEQKWITNLLRYLPQIQAAESSPLQQYHIYDRLGEMLPALFTLARAADIPLSFTWLDRWFDPDDPIAHPPVLLTGDDLKSILGIKPSPKLGQLLTAIREAQIGQIITDRAGAIEFAKTWWQDQ